MNIVLPTLWQHAEEAALLWLRRDCGVGEPHYDLKDLAKLDSRVEGNLDGLRIAVQNEPRVAWELCQQELLRAEPGEVFSVAVLAWESGIEKRIRLVLKAGAKSYECSRALVSSLGWLSEEQAAPYLERLLAHSRAIERRMGIAACAVRGRDPGEALTKAVTSSDKLLKARALRAIGELARNDLLPAAREALRSRDPLCKFSAAWSVALRSDDSKAVEALKRIVESQGSEEKSRHTECAYYFGRALQLVLRRMEINSATKWINKLAQYPKLVRQAVIGAGVLGTPDSAPWLLQVMQTPELARVAGEALTMIIGLDLAAEKFDANRPDGFESGPNDDPADENVELDPDENLPWPDVAKLTAWWQQRGGDFEPRTRYLCGRPLTEEWLEDLLRSGYQRQRAAAALELAIRRPDQPLFNVRAPGRRQQELLKLV